MVKISAERKRAIAQAWLEMTLCTYPSQSMQFMLDERDRFRNPVGHALKNGIPLLINEILDETDSERARQALEEIVRIRAVQNFSARDAVGFVFLLKRTLSQELPDDNKDRLELERRVDEMALTAFDFYSQCRAKISDIQVSEARRRVAQLQRIYSEAEGR